ncbi:MAG: hypothetical protein HQK49_17355 [Oligoflexia bacterium]|nr:hypothetical protein [Oligoflexia bacterium]
MKTSINQKFSFYLNYIGQILKCLAFFCFVLINININLHAYDFDCTNNFVFKDENKINECAAIEIDKYERSNYYSNQISPISYPQFTLNQSVNKYDTPTHSLLVQLALKSFPISKKRIINISTATMYPDSTDFLELIKHPWTHLYMLDENGTWRWGGADKIFQQNFNEGSSIEYFYKKNEQYDGDWLLGYTLHFITDVSLVVHSSLPSVKRLDLLFKHTAFEKWIQNNFIKGHNFLKMIEDDSEIYEITNPQEDLIEIAKQSSYWTSEVGYNVWNSYLANGYPTNPGSGDKELVRNTKVILKNTLRYIKGTLQFAFNKYQQIESKY